MLMVAAEAASVTGSLRKPTAQGYHRLGGLSSVITGCCSRERYVGVLLLWITHNHFKCCCLSVPKTAVATFTSLPLLRVLSGDIAAASLSATRIGAVWSHQ